MRYIHSYGRVRTSSINHLRYLGCPSTSQPPWLHWSVIPGGSAAWQNPRWHAMAVFMGKTLRRITGKCGKDPFWNGGVNMFSWNIYHMEKHCFIPATKHVGCWGLIGIPPDLWHILGNVRCFLVGSQNPALDNSTSLGLSHFLPPKKI